MAGERNIEVAVPLKQTIGQMEGLTLVRALPTFPPPYFKLTYGEAFVPGETLFVGFDRPNYDLDDTNRVVKEVYDKTGGEGTYSRTMNLGNEVTIASITFTEKLPPITRVENTIYSTKDPYLQSLLEEVQHIEVGKRYSKRTAISPTRTTYAVFYPSDLLATVAADLKHFHDTSSRFPSPLRTPQGLHGAFTRMGARDFMSLAAADNQAEELQTLASKYLPGYTLPLAG